MPEVIKPEFAFQPYPYQMFPFQQYANGKKRIILVWPQRA